MNSEVTIIIYNNGRIVDTDEGVAFEGNKKVMKIRRGISFDALKRRIHDKLNLNFNQIIASITTRFCVSNKYAALQICDDEDVEIMIDNFQQQDTSMIELCVQVDVAGGSSHTVRIDETNVDDLGEHICENIDSDEDDEGYVMSDSYAEDSSEDEDVNGNLSEDDETTECDDLVLRIPPITVAETTEGKFN